MTRFADINSRKFKSNVKRSERFFNETLPKKAYNKFKSVTPKESGYAKSKTVLKKIPNGFEITGNYAYSGVLDRGLYPNPPQGGQGKTRGGYSKKAPQGMTKPTVKYLTSEVRKFIRRLR